jgi:hypothetical protein
MPRPERPQERRSPRPLLVCLPLLILVGLGPPGCATTEIRHHLRTWSVRGLGALGSFALHEGCHFAAAYASGGSARFEADAGWFMVRAEGLSRSGYRGVAVAGNLCTGVVAEAIVDTGSHKRSDLAWGAAAFHAVNVFGHGVGQSADREFYRDMGGDDEVWQALTISHSTRIGLHLAWDSSPGAFLRRRFEPGP